MILKNNQERLHNNLKVIHEFNMSLCENWLSQHVYDTMQTITRVLMEPAKTSQFIPFFQKT